MSFAFPLGLLGLIAVPVLIAIYIIKNKYTEQVVTSTYIWTLSEKFLKRRNPINKLTGIISLILQLLAVILISFAAAQPSFTLTGAARDYYFILDGSGSMSIVQSGKTRLDLGKEKISEIIGDAVKGSRYSLVYVGDGAQLIFEDVDDKDRALAYVEELAPVCTSADVSEAVSFAQSYFEKTPTAQTYLITDTDYEVAENVTVVNVATSAVNYALYDVGYAVVADAQAGAYSLVVSGYAVSYTGDASLPVSVYFDDGAQAAASTVLEVAENVPAQFSFKFSQTDFRTAKVVLGKSDDLSLDNTCILYNLSDENSFSVLYVTDGDADEPSFMDFLLAAYGGADVEKVTADVEVAFTPDSEGAASGTFTVKTSVIYGSMITDGTDTYTYSYANGTLTTTLSGTSTNGVQLRLNDDYQLEVYIDYYGSEYKATLEEASEIVADLLTDTEWVYGEYTMSFANGKMSLTRGNDSASASYTIDEKGAITFSKVSSTMFEWSDPYESEYGGTATIVDGEVTAVSIYLYIDGDDIECTFEAKQPDGVLIVGEQQLTFEDYEARYLTFTATEDATYLFTVDFIVNDHNSQISIYTQDAYDNWGSAFVDTNGYTSNKLEVTAGQTYSLVLETSDACSITLTLTKVVEEKTISLAGITGTGTDIMGDSGAIDVTLVFGEDTVTIKTENGEVTVGYLVDPSGDIYGNHELTIGDFQDAGLGFWTGKGIVVLDENGEVTGVSITVGSNSSNTAKLTIVKAPDLKGYSGTATDEESYVDLTFTFGEDGSVSCAIVDEEFVDSFASVTLEADPSESGKFYLTFADVQQNSYECMYYEGDYCSNGSYIIVDENGSVTLYLTLDLHDNPVVFTLTKE